MEKTITYSSIEKVVYKFNESEMLDALMKTWNIERKSSKSYDLEMGKTERGNCCAILTITYEKEVKDNENEKPTLTEKTF
jgi:hypothetical protein